MSQDPDKINTPRVTDHRPLRAVAFCTDKVPDEGFVFLGEDIEREDGHLRGTIRTCVGAWGLISRKATHRSSSVREAAEEGFEPSLADPESVSRHSGLSTAVQKIVYSGQISDSMFPVVRPDNHQRYCQKCQKYWQFSDTLSAFYFLLLVFTHTF